MKYSLQSLMIAVLALPPLLAELFFASRQSDFSGLIRVGVVVSVTIGLACAVWIVWQLGKLP